MMFYEEILKALQKHRVRYLILGGTAVNLHGVPRMTADLDIAVDLSPSNISALLSAMEAVGMKISLPVNPADLADEEQRRIWQEEKNLKAITFQSSSAGGDANAYREVDVVIESPMDFDVMYASRVSLDAGDFQVDLVSLPHLIAIKRELGRKQDIADVDALERIESTGLGDEHGE